MSRLGYLDILARAMTNPNPVNLERAQAAMDHQDLKVQVMLEKAEATMNKTRFEAGLLPDPDALSTPAPLTLEARGHSEAGKAVMRLNATKHGILATVIPEHEREAYLEHVAQVFSTYNPSGYLEARLCERIASSLWRLQRLERYESAIVSRDTAQAIKKLWDKEVLHEWNGEAVVKHDATSTLEQLKTVRAALEFMGPGLDAVRDARGAGVLSWTMAFYDLAARETPVFRRAETALDRALEKLGCEDGFTEAGDLLSFDLAHPLVTAAVRSHSRKAQPVLEDWAGYAARLEERAAYLERMVAPTLEAVPHSEALSGVPAVPVTEKLAKYEAHLERGLYRALHELEAMQDRRLGKSAPLARLEVHGLGE